jgi:hypothetical protein
MRGHEAVGRRDFCSDSGRARDRKSGAQIGEKSDGGRASPDPESDDVDGVCQPIFELSPAPRAV